MQLVVCHKVLLEKILLEKTVQRHSKEKKRHKCLEKTRICKVEAIIITGHGDAGKSERSPCTSSYLYLLFCKKDTLEVLCSFLMSKEADN